VVARKSCARGLYRRSAWDESTQEWKQVRAYILDVRIPKDLRSDFAVIDPRITKSTEVSPGKKNAATTVAEMRLMLKDLFRPRDVGTLRRIQGNKLRLASAFAK
jgi:hypothetical protein